jgi:predicted DNA-binding transcriptional regulator YafY
MATNKHAIIRYQTLDKCFRNTGRRYFIEDLVNACSIAIDEFTGNDSGIKRRQVLEDIKFMESPQGWNIPLERIRDGHRVYFKYEDQNFSINNQPLNETEENQLKEALLTLSRFKGMPQFEWVDEIAARLDSGLGLTQNAEKIIEFEQNNFLTGLEHITPIYNSILYQKVINVAYQSFKQDAPQTIILHPYFLKQFNNRWYIFGQDDESPYSLNLALDRIISIQENNREYRPNTSINFDEYFEDIIGVTVNTEEAIQHIILRVSNQLLPYIQTKPIHGSQKFKGTGTTHSFITLDLIPNYELESLILSFGEGVEIMQPQSLVTKFSKRVKALYENYQLNCADELHS